jgi:hypothetical protein
MTQTVASFDLGIKNLSYCVASFDASGSLTSIDRWANLNLLADGADSQSQTRCGCGGPASWQDRVGGSLWCKKCVKKGKGGKPTLEFTGTKLAEWRTWASEGPLAIPVTEAKKLTKTILEERAAIIRLMPYKAPKAKGVSLQQLLIGMEHCLDGELPYLSTAHRIRLENQPSEFAPHMKSIQIMLFVLIDHRLRKEFGWTGTMEFVNASVKTRGLDSAGVGKEAKRSRKLAGIQRVSSVLTKDGPFSPFHTKLTWWQAQAKQDDLADAFLMCLDAIPNAVSS